MKKIVSLHIVSRTEFIFWYINVADQQLYLFSIGELDRTTIKPMIDGGTEGFKGTLFPKYGI